MDYIKQIYGHPKNLDYVFSLIENALNKKFNMNINNIPDVNNQVKKYMFQSYSKFKKEHSHMDDSRIRHNVDPYDAIDKMNKEAVESFLQYYVKEFQSKHNLNSNSTTSNANYCSFTEDSFNQASTFLTNQQKEQDKHIQKVIDRTMNRDDFFANRNMEMSGIYSDQGFNPRELHKNIVKSYEDNKKKANEYLFK